MKKALKIVVIVIVAGFIAIQFFRIDTTAKPAVPGETLESAVTVTPDVSQIFARACNDCHTNTTRYPWYTNIQPAAWFMNNHIQDARRKLNFDIFNTYTAKRKSQKIEEICDQVTSKEMPLPSYLWIHGDAVLTVSDINSLCDWSRQEKAKIVVE